MTVSTPIKSWSVWALVAGLVLDAVNEYYGAWFPSWVTLCIFSLALVCRFLSQETVREQAIRCYCWFLNRHW